MWAAQADTLHKKLRRAHLDVSHFVRNSAACGALRRLCRLRARRCRACHGPVVASYHLSVRVGAKGKASGHADYIAREGKYQRGARYEDLECSGHGNMPRWAEHSPREFWSASDEHERKGGSAYREIELALPRELDPDQRRQLVEEFVKTELGDRHAYQYAIHRPSAAIDGGEQPHAHIMYSQRMRDGIERDPGQYFKRYNAKNPERGGCRKERTGETPTERKAELKALRERWADLQNRHLAKHGHEARVDHRSLKERGIDRAPERHLGGRGVRDLQPHDITVILEKRQAEGQLERAEADASTIDTSSSIAQAKAEREMGMRRQAEARRAEAREQAQRIERIVDDEIKSGAMGAATPGGRRLGWSMGWIDWRSRALAGQGYQGEMMQRLAATTRVERRAAGVRLTCPGVIITDTGGVLAAGIDDGTDMSATARVTVAAARAKGWTTLMLEGPREYQEAVAREAQRAGIPCQMTADAVAAIEADRQRAQAQREQAAAEQRRRQVLAEIRAEMHRPSAAPTQAQAQARAAAERERALARGAAAAEARSRWWERAPLVLHEGLRVHLHEVRQEGMDLWAVVSDGSSGQRRQVHALHLDVQREGREQVQRWHEASAGHKYSEEQYRRALIESARGLSPGEMTDEQMHAVEQEHQREQRERAKREQQHARDRPGQQPGQDMGR